MLAHECGHLTDNIFILSMIGIFTIMIIGVTLLGYLSAYVITFISNLPLQSD